MVQSPGRRNTKAMDNFIDVYGENETGNGPRKAAGMSQSGSTPSLGPRPMSSLHKMPQSETPVSQIASDFTHSREMLKKHQTLNKYY